jgi:hypothetical protein
LLITITLEERPCRPDHSPDSRSASDCWTLSIAFNGPGMPVGGRSARKAACTPPRLRPYCTWRSVGRCR